MNNVVDIEEYLPHEVFEAMCVFCHHRWIAVAPEETLLKNLECGGCNKCGGVFRTGQPLPK